MLAKYPKQEELDASLREDRPCCPLDVKVHRCHGSSESTGDIQLMRQRARQDHQRVHELKGSLTTPASMSSQTYLFAEGQRGHGAKHCTLELPCTEERGKSVTVAQSGKTRSENTMQLSILQITLKQIIEMEKHFNRKLSHLVFLVK